MAYCTVDDVCASFPRFVRQQAGSISDASIQAWLEDGSSTVHAGFFSLGLDVSNLSHPKVSNPNEATPVTDQANILREIVRNYGIWRLASAIWATLSTTEQAMARGAYNRWSTDLKAITAGDYDSLFWKGSRTTAIEPGFDGVAGAETECGPHTSPPDGGNWPFFSGQVF
jgi:hypothetical protein